MSSSASPNPAAATANVTGVDFVLLPVEDLDRAREFYGSVLGLTPGKLWQRGDTPAVGAEFETGTVTLALADTAAVGGTFSVGAGSVALQVDDVAETRTRLEAAGVTFRGDTIDSGVCHMAIFTDTEGNGLMLHSRYAPAGQ